MENSLILLFGLERSGTTWLGKIMDSHPNVRYLHEPDSRRPIAGIPMVVNMDKYLKYKQDLIDFVDQLPSINSLEVLGKSPLFPKNYLNRFNFNLIKMSIFFFKALQYAGLKISLPNLYKLDKNSNLIFVWKSIASVGRLGVICKNLPRSKGILLLRHPCGHIASIMLGSKEKNFSSKKHISEKYNIFDVLLESESAKAYGLSMDLIKNMTPIERLAWRWVLFNEKAMKEIKGLTNYNTYVYDEFAENPEESVKNLFGFLNLSWNDQTKSFIEQSVRSNNSHYYSVFKDSKKAANKWKEQLTKEDIRSISTIVKDSLPGKLFKYPE